MEIVVVDDGSTDGGAGIVEGLAAEDGRVRLIRQENGGVSRARNAGIAAARGTHIAFLDADDEWRPGFLEEIAALIGRFPGAGLYSTRYDIVKENRRRTASGFLTLNPGRRFLFTNYFRTGFRGSLVWTSATVVPKTVLEETGGFLDGAGRGEDLDLWWRIAARRDVAYSRARRAVYHRDADNRSDKNRSRSTVQAAKPGRWWAVDRLEALAADETVRPDRREWMREWVRWYVILAAYNRFVRGDPEHGLWAALSESFGRFSFFYSVLRLAPRYILKR